jgi:hypothetical protein
VSITIYLGLQVSNEAVTFVVVVPLLRHLGAVNSTFWLNGILILSGSFKFRAVLGENSTPPRPQGFINEANDCLRLHVRFAALSQRSFCPTALASCIRGKVAVILGPQEGALFERIDCWVKGK